MRIEFVFPSPAGLHEFTEDFGKAENVMEGADIEMLKRYLSKIELIGTDSMLLVLGTERRWKTRSSFPELRAIIELRSNEVLTVQPETRYLYLVILEGRLKETLMSVFRLATVTFDPQDFGPAIWRHKYKPLPSAEEIRMAEKYGEQAPCQM